MGVEEEKRWDRRGIPSRSKAPVSHSCSAKTSATPQKMKDD